MRVLFWNTFLLQVRLGPLFLHHKPLVEVRAREIGAALAAADFDVVALAEVFDRPEQAVIGEGWSHVAAGPAAARWPVPTKSSGLMTLSRRPIRASRTWRYGVRGTRRRDSDAWAAKGVLMVEVATDDPDVNLEVYSTHMFYGGDLLGPPRSPDGVRDAQVGELLAAVERWHTPGNAALVVGDFNIVAAGPQGERLGERMAAAGFADVWVAHGDGTGCTCDLLEPDGPQQRIDYAFVRADGVEVVGVECLTFPRPAGDGMAFLSDHAALAVDLRL